jgi:hypothetical protein
MDVIFSKNQMRLRVLVFMMAATVSATLARRKELWDKAAELWDEARCRLIEPST